VIDLPDPTPPDELIDFIDAPGNAVDLWHGYASALRARQANGDLQAGWLMTAFDYNLRRRFGEGRDQPIGAFGEQIASSRGVYPIPLPEVPAEVIALWSDTAERVAAPGSRSRLHHLLFERGDGNRGDHARHAAAAYASLGASADQTRLTRANCLHWAVDLYKRMGDKATASSLSAALVSLAEESLSQVQPEPGVALHAIEVLAFEDPTHPALPQLLQRCRLAYTDPYVFSNVIRIHEHVTRADPLARAELRRERIQRYFDHAMSFEPGLMRMIFLEDAAKLAERDGIKDLGETAIREMQQIGIDDLGLKPVTSQIQLPPEAVQVIEDHIKTVLDLPTFAAVLHHLASSRPPSGNVDANKATRAQNAQDAPFATLFGRVQLRPDGLASTTSSTEDERAEAQLTQIEMLSMQFEGRYTARILDEALTKFSPTHDELISALLGLPHVTETIARSVARGLESFAARRYEEAATVVMPRIETLVRALCDEKEVLLFRPEQERVDASNRRGQFPQLGALLPKLLPWMDPSWDRFLSTLLVSAVGFNFRNELLHGYVDDVGPLLATMTILAALRLALVPLEQVATDTSVDEPPQPPSQA
jgi:hypothetical protein